MSYLPWPQDGCSLKAARERTADRALWRSWLDESASASHGEIEDKIFISFQEIMARGEAFAANLSKSNTKSPWCYALARRARTQSTCCNCDDTVSKMILRDSFEQKFGNPPEAASDRGHCGEMESFGIASNAFAFAIEARRASAKSSIRSSFNARWR